MDRSPSRVSSELLERWLDRAVTLAVLGIVVPTTLGVLTFLSFLVFPLVPLVGLALIPMVGARASNAGATRKSEVEAAASVVGAREPGCVAPERA